MKNYSFVRAIALLLLSQCGTSFHKHCVGRFRLIHRGGSLEQKSFLQPSTSVRSASVDSVSVNDNDDPLSEAATRRKKILATTFNLVKAVAGSGILALPGGVAAMSDFKERYDHV